MRSWLLATGKVGTAAIACGALASCQLGASQLSGDSAAGASSTAQGGIAPLSFRNIKERYGNTIPLKGCALRPLSTMSAPTYLEPALAKSQAYHDKYRGTALVVLHRGQVIYERYTDGADADTQPASQSMMKSVLGMLVGIAIEKQLIASVDDPIGLYVSEWANDPRGEITVKEMLQMASGLKPFNFALLMTATNVNTMALKGQLADTPGTQFEYDSAVSQILENIIDRQAKAKGYEGFADFMQQELWCPLGNRDASLWVDMVGNPHGFAGLNTTARDWARIGELLNNKGRAGDRQIVDIAWIEAMSKPSPANAQYGYQLWLGNSWTKTRSYNSNTTFGAPQGAPFIAKDTAFFDGFGGLRVYVIPSRKLTIVRLGKMTFKYDETVIPNLIVGALDENQGAAQAR